MTFLEICQAVGTDSGLISFQNRPATVVGALGKWAEIVGFTASAWSDIQRGRQDWEFMRGDFSHALTIAQASYDPVDLGITTRFARFASDLPDLQPHRLHDAVLGEADSMDLHQISPECWSMIYGRGAQAPQRPTEYALANNKFYVGSVPDKAYILAGSYWKSPQVLVADTDVPDMPEHFHDVIKWRSIMRISGKDGAFADRVVAQAEYSSGYRQLVKEQTRPIRLGGTLA